MDVVGSVYHLQVSESEYKLEGDRIPGCISQQSVPGVRLYLMMGNNSQNDEMADTQKILAKKADLLEEFSNGMTFAYR